MALNKGFTLLEMLVVIAIIAILATLAIPSYMSSIARDQIVESVRLVEQLKPPVEAYQKLTATLPARNLDAGIPEPEKLIGNYVQSIELQNGGFHIHFGNKAAKALQGKILSVRAITVSGSPSSPMSWLCGYSALPKGMEAKSDNRTDIQPAGWLPVGCR